MSGQHQHPHSTAYVNQVRSLMQVIRALESPTPDLATLAGNLNAVATSLATGVVTPAATPATPDTSVKSPVAATTTTVAPAITVTTTDTTS